MLYPKGKKISLDSAAEIRMSKMSRQKDVAVGLLDNLKRFTGMMEEMVQLERQITDQFMELYTTESTYGQLINKLNGIMRFKDGIIRKELKTLKDEITRQKNLSSLYSPLKPIFKQYFTVKDSERHYKHKLIKLEQQADRKQSKSRIPDKEMVKLMRNKGKHESAQNGLRMVTKAIFDETNILNIQKFKHLNPLVREFIRFNTSYTVILKNRFKTVEDFIAVLAKSESNQYNHMYFMDAGEEDVNKIFATQMKSNLREVKQSFTSKSFVERQNTIDNRIREFKENEDSIKLLKSSFIAESRRRPTKTKSFIGETDLNMKRLPINKSSIIKVFRS